MPVTVFAPANAHNFGSRRGAKVGLVILHTMEGYFEPTLEEFANPSAGVSAHYCVSADGRIALCVSEDYAAFHAGNADFNARSVGIELEGFAGQDFPDAQLDATCGLVLEICHRYGLPFDRSNVIGHREVPDPRDPTKFGGISHHGDPGVDFPWGRIVPIREAA